MNPCVRQPSFSCPFVEKAYNAAEKIRKLINVHISSTFNAGRYTKTAERLNEVETTFSVAQHHLTTFSYEDAAVIIYLCVLLEKRQVVQKSIQIAFRQRFQRSKEEVEIDKVKVLLLCQEFYQALMDIIGNVKKSNMAPEK